MDNDVGIVQLVGNVPAGIGSLSIASANFRRGELFYVYGYGQTESGGRDQLRGGSMRATAVNSLEIIAAYEAGESSTCYGDSGGPAIRAVNKGTPKQRLEVVAIISSGEPSCMTASFFSPVVSAGTRQFITQHNQ